jgi:plastocyanin
MLPMRTSLKPNLERTDLLFASPVHQQEHTARRVSVLSPILKHVNTGTLAFAMFVSLALLSTPVVAFPLTFLQSKDSQTRESAPVKATKTEVAIDNFSFSPNTLTLSVGGTVTWTNHDNVPHVVSSADDQFKKSPLLKTGQSFSHSFATRGTYNYFCSIHPRMTGRIIVK